MVRLINIDSMQKHGKIIGTFSCETCTSHRVISGNAVICWVDRKMGVKLYTDEFKRRHKKVESVDAWYEAFNSKKRR